MQHLGDDIHATGDLAEGKETLEQSLAVARQANSKQLIADDAYMLADIAREEKAFKLGEELLNNAEAYYTTQKQKISLWDASISEARLRIAEHKSMGTDKLIGEAINGYRGVKDEAKECGAYAVLMEAYLAQNKPRDAAHTLANSRALCTATPEYEMRMLYKIRSIEVQAADPERQRQQLQSVIRDLEGKGWGDLAREARTALKKQQSLVPTI